MFGLSRMAFAVLEIVLIYVTRWLVFEKYNEPGWKGLIPFYSDYIEFGKVWDAPWGIVYIVANLMSSLVDQNAAGMVGAALGILYLASLILKIFYARRKQQAFRLGGIGFLAIIVCEELVNLYIAFNKNVKYWGNPSL